MPVTLELEDHVHQVLDGAWAGDRPVLGHVTDEQHRDARGLGEGGERGGDRPGLRHTAGDTLHTRGVQGLQGIDDDELRAGHLDLPQRGLQVVLCGEPEVRGQCVGASGALADLPDRLLGGDVEDAAVLPGPPVRDLQQERGLADAGLTGEQDRTAGHHTTAEDAVELADTAGPVHRPGGVDVGDLPGR